MATSPPYESGINSEDGEQMNDPRSAGNAIGANDAFDREIFDAFGNSGIQDPSFDAYRPMNHSCRKRLPYALNPSLHKSRIETKGDGGVQSAPVAHCWALALVLIMISTRFPRQTPS